MHWIRRLYDWVLSWAETPYGAAALFVLAVTESIFFPVPPDVLLIALALGQRKRALYFGLICSVGSLCGGAIGYMLGHYVWLTPDGFTPLAQFFFHNVPGFSESVYADLGRRFDEWGFVIIFTAGFTPVPYKLFTISAGAFGTSFPLFLLASVVSRTARFMLVSGLIWRFGEPVRIFIDRYFNWLAIAFTVLLVGGFALLKFLT
ncbi:MAG: DedA family protein [Rhodothermaceae bacterium]|nr:VTT domain-containing protein [Bacteroidota bacterium]MXW14591.1 DedA family protein [Rhodothermaceae bacterium]MDE2644629.1 VTT domain-containing protein [Bacteroidota bacterium]MXW31612.1 DedA family protein [Rhodothermaceae bacterium]MXX96188.1 DedA family protein [Rhodothermaceae bacterium]